MFQCVCLYRVCVDAEGIISDSLWRFPQEEVCVCVIYIETSVRSDAGVNELLISTNSYCTHALFTHAHIVVDNINILLSLARFITWNQWMVCVCVKERGSVCVCVCWQSARPQQGPSSRFSPPTICTAFTHTHTQQGERCLPAHAFRWQ